jgi:hypothetical protein
MLRQDHKHFVRIAYGNIGQANYAASKAGILGLAATAAQELGRKNITVNTVLPGYIDTDILKTVPEKFCGNGSKKSPCKGWGTPEEVASAVSFFCKRRFELCFRRKPYLFRRRRCFLLRFVLNPFARFPHEGKHAKAGIQNNRIPLYHPYLSGNLCPRPCVGRAPEGFQCGGRTRGRLTPAALHPSNAKTPEALVSGVFALELFIYEALKHEGVLFRRLICSLSSHRCLRALSRGRRRSQSGFQYFLFGVVSFFSRKQNPVESFAGWISCSSRRNFSILAKYSSSGKKDRFYKRSGYAHIGRGGVVVVLLPTSFPKAAPVATAARCSMTRAIADPLCPAMEGRGRLPRLLRRSSDFRPDRWPIPRGSVRPFSPPRGFSP